MTIEEYLRSLTGQRLTLEQLRALSQGGLLSGGDFMGRTVGDVVGGGPRSPEEWAAQAYQQLDPNGAPTLREGWTLDAAGNPLKTLTAADVQAQNLQLAAGDYGPGGAYGGQNYGLTANDDGTYTLGEGSFQDYGGNHQIGGTFFDRYAPMIAGGLITGGALGLFGAGGAGAAGAGGAGLGMGADGMSAMALGSGGAGAAGAAGSGLSGLEAWEAGGAGQGAYAPSYGSPAGWNSEIGLSGAAGDFGAASGVAAPAGYTGAAQTLAGTGAAQTLGSKVLSGATDLLGSKTGGALAGAALGALASTDTPTATTESNVDPATAAFRDRYRQEALNTYGLPFTPYTGERVAGMTPEQQAAGGVFQQSVNNLPQTMGQIQSLLGSGTTPVSSAQNGLLGQTQDYLGQATQPMTATANAYAQQDNPYLQGTIAAANRGLVDSYNTITAPKFAQAGSYGSSALAQYEAQERANLARQMSDNANNLSYQGYNLGAQLAESGANRQDTLNNAVAGRALSAGSLLGGLGEQAAGRTDAMGNANANRYLTGAQQAQSAALLPNQIGQSLLGYGNQQQLTNQMTNDAAYEEFMRSVNYPREQLGLLGQAAGMQNGTTQTQQQSQSLWSNILGGALAGGKLASWL
jgi:hypothetical protein